MIKTFKSLIFCNILCLIFLSCTKTNESDVENSVIIKESDDIQSNAEDPVPAEIKDSEQEDKDTPRIIKSYTARSWMKNDIYPEDFDLGVLSVESELSQKERIAVKNAGRFIRAVRKSDGSASKYLEENASDAILSLMKSFNTKLWSFSYYQSDTQNDNIILTARINEGRQQVLAEIHFDNDIKITIFEIYYRPERDGLFYPGSFSGAPSFL